MDKCPKCGAAACTLNEHKFQCGVQMRDWFGCTRYVSPPKGTKACLLRQLAAANERAGRLEKALIEWEGDWFTGGKTKIAADNRLRELLIEMRIIDRILGGA